MHTVSPADKMNTAQQVPETFEHFWNFGGFFLMKKLRFRSEFSNVILKFIQ